MANQAALGTKSGTVARFRWDNHLADQVDRPEAFLDQVDLADLAEKQRQHRSCKKLQWLLQHPSP